MRKRILLPQAGSEHAIVCVSVYIYINYMLQWLDVRHGLPFMSLRVWM